MTPDPTGYRRLAAEAIAEAVKSVRSPNRCTNNRARRTILLVRIRAAAWLASRCRTTTDV